MGGSSLAPEVIRLSFGDQDGWPLAARARLDRRGRDPRRPRRSTSSKRCSSSRRSRAGRSRRCRCSATSGRCGPRAASSSRSPTPAPALADLAERARLPPHVPQRPRHRRALQRAVVLRARARGADGRRRRRPARPRRASPSRTAWRSTRRRRTGPLARRAPGASSRCAGRDKLTYVVDPPLELRPVGRAAHRRVDRQAGQGHRPDRRRAARRRPRTTATTACSCTCATSTSPTPSTTRRSTRSRRPGHPVDHPDHPRPDRPRAAVLLRRVRDRGRRAGCSGSTRSTSPTCRRPRTRRSGSSRRAPGTSPTPTTTRCARCCPASAPRTTSRRWATSSRRRRFDAAVTELRAAIRDATRSATTFGYGPRFLHSTGQLHKGGPPVGRFLQIVHDSEPDVEIPGADYGFTRAQARAGHRRPRHAPRARPAGRARDAVRGRRGRRHAASSPTASGG